MAKGLGHVYQRGRIWWIKYYVEGIPRFESSESTNKTEATNLLKKRLGKPVKTKTKNVLVEELLNDLLDFYRGHRPKSYETFAVPVIRHLSRGVGPHRATKVSPTILKAYVEKRQSENAKNASINRELALLRRAFNLGREAGKVERDTIPTFRLLPEDTPRKGFVEPEQYRKLFDAMPEALKPALVVGYHTGLRRAKVLGLRIDQFDLAAKKIYMDKEEGRTTKHVAEALPIYGEMEEFVKFWIEKTRRELPNCQWFCHRANGDPVLEPKKEWARAAKEAGMPGLLFHDLRRSAVRNMERAGVPRSVAMKISGHKTESIYKRYDIVSERDLDEAGDKLAEYLGAKKGAAA
jgi:integrase